MSSPLLNAKHVINKYYDDLARHRVGEMQRATNRTTQLYSIHRKALMIIEKKVPKMFHEPPNANGFNQEWADINTELLQQLPRYADYHRAINFVAGVLQQGNQSKVWSVKLPPSLVSIKRDRPMRTKKWFAQAKVLALFHQNWLKAIDNESYMIDAQHADNVFTALLLSMVFCSGANHKSTLLAFVEALNAKPKLLSLNGYYYLELVIDDKSFNTNVFDSYDEAITVLRLFLPPHACALFKLWYKSTPPNWQYPTTEHEVRSLLNNNLQALGFNIKSLGMFCKAAVTIAENQPNARIPQALIEYVTARNKSYSMAQDDWLDIFGRQIAPLSPMAFSDFKTISSLKADDRQFKRRTRSNHFLVGILNKALRTEAKGLKRTSQMAIAAIKAEVNLAELATQERLLVNWLLSILAKNKLSTATRYHGSIGGIWLASSVDVDLYSYQPDDFLELYHSAAEMATSDKEKHYKAALLQQMHQYGVIFEGFEPLPENLVTGTETTPHTRAGFIDETLFAALLNCIDQFTDQTDYQRAQLKALLIVGYRTGMRLGELIKFRIMDIEPSNIGWIFVRSNKIGDNKSSAAKRKIPLYVLLTPAENELVSSHIQRQRALHKSNALLFSEAQTPFIPLARQQVSNMTSQLLRQLAPGSHYVFHHLRHSALTRLQVVLHIELFKHNYDASFAKQLLPYTYEHALQIKQLICGANRRSIYWCLAVFAGHRSPETSFNRYFHCSDLLFYEHIKQSRFMLTFNQARAFSGIGIHQMRKIFNKRNIIDFAEVRGIIESKLKTVSQVQRIKPPSKPHQLEQKKQQQDVPAICYHLLLALENGENIQLLASKYRMPQAKIEQWLQNALALKQRLNYKGKQRLFSTERDHKLLPGPLRSTVEKQLLNKAYQICRKLFKEDAVNLYWVIEYALDHSSSSKSYISFTSPADLARFIEVAIQICPKSNWVAEVQLLKGHKEHMQQWRQAATGIRCIRGDKLKQNNRNPQGNAHLRLRHPNEDKMSDAVDGNKYSSNLTKHLFHMLWIMMTPNQHQSQPNLVSTNPPKTGPTS